MYILGLKGDFFPEFWEIMSDFLYPSIFYKGRFGLKMRNNTDDNFFHAIS